MCGAPAAVEPEVPVEVVPEDDVPVEDVPEPEDEVPVDVVPVPEDEVPVEEPPEDVVPEELELEDEELEELDAPVTVTVVVALVDPLLLVALSVSVTVADGFRVIEPLVATD